jgi:hypothetical protein
MKKAARIAPRGFSIACANAGSAREQRLVEARDQALAA